MSNNNGNGNRRPSQGNNRHKNNQRRGHSEAESQLSPALNKVGNDIATLPSAWADASWPAQAKKFKLTNAELIALKKFHCIDAATASLSDDLAATTLSDEAEKKNNDKKEDPSVETSTAEKTTTQPKGEKFTLTGESPPFQSKQSPAFGTEYMAPLATASPSGTSFGAGNRASPRSASSPAFGSQKSRSFSESPSQGGSKAKRNFNAQQQQAGAKLTLGFHAPGTTSAPPSSPTHASRNSQGSSQPVSFTPRSQSDYQLPPISPTSSSPRNSSTPRRIPTSESFDNYEQTNYLKLRRSSTAGVGSAKSFDNYEQVHDLRSRKQGPPSSQPGAKQRRASVQGIPVPGSSSESNSGGVRTSKSLDTFDPGNGSPSHHPSHTLLEEFDDSKYKKYENKCLKERARMGCGKSPKMNTLYRFWSHHLRHVWNEEMYKTFKEQATNDAQEAQAMYGLECLFRFYSYGLEKKFQQDLFDDFQALVSTDLKEKHAYGLEKFWAFLHYRPPNARKLKINPELQKELEKYHSIEDFRVTESISSFPLPSPTTSSSPMAVPKN